MKTSLRTPSATMLFAAATMLLLLSSLAQATAKKKYRHKCGKFREARSTTARIINGKTVKKHYPWMVKVSEESTNMFLWTSCVKQLISSWTSPGRPAAAPSSASASCSRPPTARAARSSRDPWSRWDAHKN